jgi:hypothetical protein
MNLSEEQLGKLRQILEFYANPEVYVYRKPALVQWKFGSEATNDAGERAREALEILSCR